MTVLSGSEPSAIDTSRGVTHVLMRSAPLILALLTVISVWELVVLALRPDPSVLPSPVVVLSELVQLVSSGELIVDAGISIFRVVTAWLISAIIAVPLGISVAWWRPFERVADPVIELFRPISPMAWIPLAILWFGINEAGKIFVVCVATFFPTLLSTIAGVKRIDPVLIQAGKVLGCTRVPTLLVGVVVPAALPSILVGLRISFGIGWAAIIAAELVAARSGLGYLISNGMEILRADEVMAGMATIAILGVSFDTVFRWATSRLVWSA
jgi:ABC-type nitrate/sulfonate/bicarbonate transport system permease component